MKCESLSDKQTESSAQCIERWTFKEMSNILLLSMKKEFHSIMIEIHFGGINVMLSSIFTSQRLVYIQYKEIFWLLWRFCHILLKQFSSFDNLYRELRTEISKSGNTNGLIQEY